MQVTNIKWETGVYKIDLPTEAEVPDYLVDDYDGIADFLSDTYGWLVESFSLPMTDNDIVNEAEGRVS